MNYETFSFDLPTQGRHSFKSCEQNEAVYARSGFDIAVRQIGKGKYRADLATGRSGECVLFSQRVNVALTMNAGAPADSVLFLIPRWNSGKYMSAGIELRNQALLFPAGEVIDLVLPDLAGSDSILVPKKRYLELAAALCPDTDPPEESTVLEFNNTQLNQLRSVFSTLMNCPDPGNAPEASASLLAPLVNCLAEAANRGQCNDLRDRVASMRCARTAREFIEAHYRETLCIDELCRATGVGVRTLQRYFRGYFGISISEYLKAVRLDAVYRSLAAADLHTTTVTQVGHDHGCTHLGRLSVQFHERFGKCPSQVLAERRA